MDGSALPRSMLSPIATLSARHPAQRAIAVAISSIGGKVDSARVHQKACSCPEGNGTACLDLSAKTSGRFSFLQLQNLNCLPILLLTASLRATPHVGPSSSDAVAVRKPADTTHNPSVLAQILIK